MKTIRYWLGLPLFNVINTILLIILLAIANAALVKIWFYGNIYGGLFVFPLITALYYPVCTEKSMEMKKLIGITLGIVFTWTFLAIMIFGSISGYFVGDWKWQIIVTTAVSVIVSVIEIIGYSIGLALARRIDKSRAN